MGIMDVIKRFIYGTVLCPTDKFELYVEQIRALMNYEIDIFIAEIDANEDDNVDVSEAIRMLDELRILFIKSVKNLRKMIKNVK